MSSLVKNSGLIVRMRATALPHPDERQTERAGDDGGHPEIDESIHDSVLPHELTEHVGISDHAAGKRRDGFEHVFFDDQMVNWDNL